MEETSREPPTWRGCTEEELAETKEEVRELLERHRIPMEEYGTGDALGLVDLAREVKLGLGALREDEAGDLIRHVTLVEVSLVACLPASRLVLVEEERVLGDGRHLPRPQSEQRLHAKMRSGEAPVPAARRAVVERLGLRGSAAQGALALPATLDTGTSAGSAEGVAEGAAGEAAEEAPEIYTQASSQSYPGLPTRYAVHRVELRLMANESGRAKQERQVIDPDRDALLSDLGLPLGRSFLSVEGPLGSGKGGCVHLWRWALAEMDQERVERRISDATSDLTGEQPKTEEDAASHEAEDEGQAEDLQEDMTPLEQADRDVKAVLRILESQKATFYERGGPQEKQLCLAQDRLRRVLRRFANVDNLVSVDTKQLFGCNTPEKTRRLSKSLLRFIKTSFANPESEAEVHPEPHGLARVFLERESSVPSSPLEGMHGIVEEVEALRTQGAESSWVFDCLELHLRTSRRALLAVAELHVVPNATSLGSSDATMREFVTAIHGKYEEHPNPFHNEAHASIVCHSTHWLASRGRARHSPAFQVATDIAALAHDVGHFGRNNLFCANSGNELALMYNDKSILENMHAATCFQLMRATRCDILRGCSLENRKKYREHMVDLILATDMSSHFDFLGKFRLRASSLEFSPQDCMEDRRLVERCYLKAADLGHTALPFEIHERWALRLLTEFYEQGDEELQLGLPISPMCERNGNVNEFCESQKGFLQFVVLPLFKELALVTSPEVGETCVTRLEVNAEDWIKSPPTADLIAVVMGQSRQARSNPRNESSQKHLRKEVTFHVPASPEEEEGDAGRQRD